MTRFFCRRLYLCEREKRIVIWRGGKKNIKHEHFHSIFLLRCPLHAVHSECGAHKFHSHISHSLLSASYNCFAFFNSNLKSHTRERLFVWFRFVTRSAAMPEKELLDMNEERNLLTHCIGNAEWRVQHNPTAVV